MNVTMNVLCIHVCKSNKVWKHNSSFRYDELLHS